MSEIEDRADEIRALAAIQKAGGQVMPKLEPVKGAIAKFLRGTEVQTDRMQRLQALCRFCQSPIEKDMAQAMIDDERLTASGAPTIITDAELIEGSGLLAIVPQFKIGRLVPDFALNMQGGRKLLVECDGIEWHDRTNEQFMSERQRERDLLILGWPTMRFTGKEIMRDPARCVADIAAYLTGSDK